MNAEAKPARRIGPATIVIIVGVLATTLPQTEVLARLPLQNLLKNTLALDRASNSAFFFWAGLAWYVKPLIGIVTDAFPLLGSRRRNYLLLGASLATLAWLGMGAVPPHYGALLGAAIVVNVFMVLCSTVIGATIVEAAQGSGASGRLTAIRQLVMQACSIVNGPIAGFLASLAFFWTTLACGCVTAALVPVTALFLRERRENASSQDVLGKAREQFRRIAKARTMWAATGLLALFYIAPGFSTALFYRQQNELHMDTAMQGTLGLIAGLCGVAAALLYGVLCRHLSLRTLLVACVALGTAANLFYLFYSSWPRAELIEGANGFGYTLAELALLDLAVRATPAGSEGLGFALMVSVRNLCLFGTDWAGSALLESTHVSFGALVIANSVTTALAIPLVFLLPRVIVGRRDAAPELAPLAGPEAKERFPL